MSWRSSAYFGDISLVNSHASALKSTLGVPPILILLRPASISPSRASGPRCHETRSLVVQHAFENLEESAKDRIVDELLGRGTAVFGELSLERIQLARRLAAGGPIDELGVVVLVLVTTGSLEPGGSGVVHALFPFDLFLYGGLAIVDMFSEGR
ncbi:hypothetical protein B0H14DRAFT_3461065 [Mycena olivaceomarginata]|nr:hypothetical protein B0H14DRAFT_3461065 [Mycena olivaceomarginata]